MQKSDSISEVLLSEAPKTGYLRQSELISEILPFSAATLWRMVKAGKFPRPIKLSKRITVWRYADVAEWLDKLHKEAAGA